VAQGPGKRQLPPPQVVALILLTCIITGLIAGAGTQRLVASLVLRGANTPSGISGLSTGSPGNLATATSPPGSSPSAIVTPTSSPQGGLTGFSVQEQVSPAAVSVGQQFTVTATVLAKDSLAPLEGVSCTIGAAGGAKLFADWPAAVLTNTHGIAAWILQAPNVTPGTYQMKVQGDGSRGYYVYVDASIVITGA
jgi:hypothetical protein